MRGTSKASAVLQLGIMFLPWSVRRFLMARLLGYRIAATATIGRSLVLADRVELEPGAVIKHLTMIKGLSELIMAPNSWIGNLNWITGLPADEKMFFLDEPDRVSALVIEDSGTVTNRHLLDCSNRITIGRFTTIGGFRSQFLTHSIDLGANRQTSKPIDIGEYCFTGTGVIILKGAALPARCVLGAGSMLRSRFTDEHKLVAGNPAKPLQDLAPDSKYFHRTSTRVH